MCAEVLSRLFSWVKIGLDLESALAQPQPGYKIRHIKAGIRLVEALCSCGKDVVARLLTAHPVHHLLLQLYQQDHMALSIKLMILRALDASLRCQFAVQHFLDMRTTVLCENSAKLETDKKEEAAETYNGYQALVLLLQSNQLSRAKFAISSLLRKLHMYELLEMLKRSVKSLLAETAEMDSENDVATDPELVDTIIACLDEVVRVYKDAPLTISQLKRFLPVCAQFEIVTSAQDKPRPYPALFSFFRAHKLLENCLALLTAPQTSNYAPLVGPVHDVLWMLADSQEGLQFLAASGHVTSALLRHLLQTTHANPEEIDESAISPPSPQYLGLCIAYRLQALAYIDQIWELMHSGPSDPERPEIFDNLFGLCCLGLSPLGKLSLAHVLTRGDSIRCLLKLISHPQSLDARDIKYKKSPGQSFVADLIATSVKLSESGAFLREYGREILALALTPSTKLQDLVPWLKPVDEPFAFSCDDIPNLCEIVKNSIENAVSLPAELITSVRLLKYLCIAENDRDPESEGGINDDGYHELKYKYALLELFSMEGVSHLTSILSKICEAYEQPALHASALSGMRGSILVGFMLPALELLRRMLTAVIQVSSFPALLPWRSVVVSHRNRRNFCFEKFMLAITFNWHNRVRGSLDLIALVLPTQIPKKIKVTR